MNLQEINNEEMYCMVAPDGFPQTMTLAPDFAMCVALVQVLHKKGVGKSYFEMTRKGYEILPVKISMSQNGTAEEGFKKAKAAL